MTATDETGTEPPDGRRIGRRGFIVGGVGLAGAAAVGIGLATSGDDAPAGDEPADLVEPAPADPVGPTSDRVTGIQALGARYRELAPAATSAAALGALPAMGSVDDVEAAFARDRSLIRDDYADGNVVLVDGWRFAEREALLAAQASTL